MMQMEIEMCDTECLGQIQLREKWRRQWTVTKIRGKMLRKILKTLFETQSTHFLRLKWVANKSPGLAAKTLKNKIVKNFLSVFPTRRFTREGVASWAAKISMYPSRLDLLLVNKSPKLTCELATEFRDFGDLRLSRQNRVTMFLKFFSFCKKKILSRNT